VHLRSFWCAKIFRHAAPRRRLQHITFHVGIRLINTFYFKQILRWHAWPKSTLWRSNMTLRLAKAMHSMKDRVCLMSQALYQANAREARYVSHRWITRLMKILIIGTLELGIQRRSCARVFIKYSRVTLYCRAGAVNSTGLVNTHAMPWLHFRHWYESQANQALQNIKIIDANIME